VQRIPREADADNSRRGTACRAPTLSRRGFLRGAAAVSAALAAPWVLSPAARGAGGAVAPSNRLAVGLIGKGRMGSGHLRRLISDPAVLVPAVCDVDRTRCEDARRQADEAYAAERAAGAYRGCAAYNDYRELLARPDVDAVVIATPDHWHSLISIDAAKAGKDVYCEKPVSVTIAESRRMADAVRRNARVFQTGTQYRSMPAIRAVCALVRAGGLGRIKSVFSIWGNLNIPTIGPSPVPLDPVLPADPVPEGLDWDLWVGPATYRPYNRAYHRNPIPGVVPWTFCEAFGVGQVTNHQSHSADVIQYALGVETSGPVEIHHPSGGQFPTLTCRYASGTLLHFVAGWHEVKTVYKAVPDAARLAGLFGGLFVGERGWVTSMYGGGPIEGAPDEIFEEMDLKTRDPAMGGNNHHANWLECIRTRGRPSSHEEIGHRSASLGHLVTIAFRLGRSLKWDPAREEFSGDDQANRLCSRAMREPWRL